MTIICSNSMCFDGSRFSQLLVELGLAHWGAGLDPWGVELAQMKKVPWWTDQAHWGAEFAPWGAEFPPWEVELAHWGVNLIPWEAELGP